MNNQDLIMNFPITVYGNLEKYNETVSKGRCRIFYKGHNRNNTFISDEFAEKLIATIPYTPVKGIYDVEDSDYTDHGENRSEGRIYGIVPENPNFAWETHLDEDGQERDYACVDVYYFTALYPEAQDVAGKGQSMELYKPSIKGEWKTIDGKHSYVFSEGCFLGLQILGDEVEPCFEGAAFYTIEDTVKLLVQRLETYQRTNSEHKQGGKTMPSITFKVSDEKQNALWALLNPNFNEEGGWVVENSICEVCDEYALVRNYEQGIFERVYYTKNEESDSVEITNREQCFIVNMTETEKNELNEKFSVLENEKAALEAQNSEYSMKIEEFEATISTLSTEKTEMSENYAVLNEQFSQAKTAIASLEETLAAVTEERDALASYKKTVEDNAKKAIVTSYSEQLPEEVINKFLEEIDSYSLENLDMVLTYEVKKSNPNLFSKAPEVPAYLPKDNARTSGISEILSRYEKKNKN
jgi:hypothetical protein